MGRNSFNTAKSLTKTALGACLGVVGLCAGFAPSAQADDPAFLSIAAGAYDFNRQKDQGAEFRVEYRGETKYFGFLKPFAAVAGATSSSSFFVGAGVLTDLYWGKRVVVTPSFAPHYYNGGNEKLDLDYALEFRNNGQM